ncbi:MAG: hypothetical protein L0Z62_01685, partial [Gemmataceae bacterium]|nr:hypothetical protein [Gemmataceae bacterium]
LAGAVSARASAFAEEVLRTMRMTKVKIALTSLVLVIGCATGLLTYPGHAQAPAEGAPGEPGAGVGAPQQAVPQPVPQPGGFPGPAPNLPQAGAVPGAPPVAQPGGVAGAPGFAPPPPLRWQYKALSRNGVCSLGDKAPKEVDRLAAGLTRLSAEGWELFAIDPAHQGGESTYLFRRAAVAAPGGAGPMGGAGGGGTGIAPPGGVPLPAPGRGGAR